MSTLVQDQVREFFVEDEVPHDLGWTVWLTAENLREFRKEMMSAIEFKCSSDELAALLDAWKATAELDHSAEVRAQIERNRKSDRWASVDQWMSGRKSIA